MNEIISNYLNELEQLQSSIIDQLVNNLRNIDFTSNSSEYKIVQIQELSDLNNIIYGSGFYIILSNIELEGNNCTMQIGDCKAIYRGHGSNVKKRIMSHLFNSEYMEKHKRDTTLYTVCLKIKENDKGGININSDKNYSSKIWKVAVFKMKNSTKQLREFTEKAFDLVYSRPICCREHNN